MGVDDNGGTSLLVICRPHGINPYTDFVDVLQRTSKTKAADVADLTPNWWKELLAQQPLILIFRRISAAEWTLTAYRVG